jgi:type II secretory pathway predicted ATPase ExeA/septal ring-binding cell division protein DamX
MHKDFENSVISPFQATNDLENFFMGGGRTEVLSQLQESVAVGIPLLVLTGEEGSGKTLLCRMLQQRIAEECVVIYFQHTVESFDDVVHIIARQLGIATVPEDDKGGGASIEDIVIFLLEKRSHLCIIFDEAENIYLATLERIRKILGQMTEAGVYLHVLFSGRPSFVENYEQLIICDFKQIEEVYLSLDPLSEVETADYLEGCMVRLPSDTQRNVFTEEVIGKICEFAKGNFGMINSLAEKSIATPGDNSSFMVLLDSVADEKEDESAGFSWSRFLPDIKQFTPLISWIGGAVFVVALLFLVFGSGDEEETEKVVLPKKVAEKQQEIIIVKKRVTRSEPVVQDVVEKKVDRAVVIPEAISEAEEASVKETNLQTETAQPEVKEVVVEVIKEIEADNEKVEETDIVSEIPKETVHQEVIAEPLKREEVIVELRQLESLKKKVGVFSLVKGEKSPIYLDAEVQKNSSTNAHLTVDQLYVTRIAAGKVWGSGAKDSKYTIQLMVLTSKNAEGNLKQMLAQEKYRQQAPNFYIFKKNKTPAGLLVYYGEYPTIAEARRMTKSIPAFLQKHKPYAVSIKGAVAKVGM